MNQIPQEETLKRCPKCGQWRTFHGDCPCQSIEIEPLPFSEPPIDEEDTVQMTPAADQPQELPEDIQGAIGYLQQLIEDLEAGKRDTGSGLTVGQDMTLQAALSWVAYYESLPEYEEDEGFTEMFSQRDDEKEDDDPDWHDDYPDCRDHGEIMITNDYGQDVCAKCGNE